MLLDSISGPHPWKFNANPTCWEAVLSFPADRNLSSGFLCISAAFHHFLPFPRVMHKRLSYPFLIMNPQRTGVPSDLLSYCQTSSARQGGRSWGHLLGVLNSRDLLIFKIYKCFNPPLPYKSRTQYKFGVYPWITSVTQWNDIPGLLSLLPTIINQKQIDVNITRFDTWPSLISTVTGSGKKKKASIQQKQ